MCSAGWAERTGSCEEISSAVRAEDMLALADLEGLSRALEADCSSEEREERKTMGQDQLVAAREMNGRFGAPTQCRYSGSSLTNRSSSMAAEVEMKVGRAKLMRGRGWRDRKRRKTGVVEAVGGGAQQIYCLSGGASE